jgi:outer membrane protein TolC
MTARFADRACAALFAVAATAAPALGADQADLARANTAARRLTLDEAIATAYEHNPDMQAAADRIAEATARVGEATAAFYPQISTRLSYARTDNPAQAFAMVIAQRRLAFSPTVDFNHPGATQNVRPEISAALPLFRGGQDLQRRAAAVLGVAAATFEAAAVRNGLADAVIAAYYVLLAAPEQVDATQASIEAVNRALAQARDRFEAGALLKSDVLSLETRLAEATASQVQAANAVELARLGLRTLLGAPAETVIDATPGSEPASASVPTSLSDALASARSRRPELGAAASLVAIRTHELNAERAAYFPRVDAVGTYGQDAENLELSSSQDNWFFGATAEMDLFSGFRTAERVRAARHRLDEARAAERRTQLEVERELTAAWLRRDEARERARVTESAVASADEALRLVQQQYQTGTVTVTRYLEVEAARTAARSRVIAARYDARRAEAGVLRAVGYWADAPAEVTQ